MSDTTVTAKAAPMSQLPQSGPKRVMLKGAILSLALLLQSIFPLLQQSCPVLNKTFPTLLPWNCNAL